MNRLTLLLNALGVSIILAILLFCFKPHRRFLAMSRAKKLRKQQGKSDWHADDFWDDFWAFRRMISPVIIQVLFYIGVAACVIRGAALISQGEPEPVSWGVAFILVGPVVLRLYCEFVILFFRINETLTEIKNQL